MNEKPFKGEIRDWYKYYFDDENFIIEGTFVSHPDFAGLFGHTSKVVSFNEETGDIETLNSRYKLVGEHKQPISMKDELEQFNNTCDELEMIGFKVERF